MPARRPAEPQAPTRLRDAWPALLALAVVFLLEMLDTSILSVALPSIARDLGADASTLQWVSGSYSLVFGSTMLLFGGVADRFGRRRLLLVGLGLVVLTSAATVLVAQPWQLIALRAAAGIAAALTAPGTMAMTFRLFPDDALRARATALISGIGLTGLVAGPLVGGLVLAVLPWQWLLAMNAPIALVAGWGITCGISADTPDELRRDPVDVLGGALATIAMTALLVAPTLALEPAAEPWLPIASLAAAACAGTGFVWREQTAKHPLMRPRLLRSAPVSAGLGMQLAIALATAAIGATVQLQLQLGWGWPPAAAALGTLPQVVAMIAGGPIVEPIIRRLGLTRSAAVGAGAVVIAVAGYAIWSRLGYLVVAGATVLMALGMRVVMITSTIQVMKGLPRDHLSIAAALNDTAQELGSAIGIAATGAVLSASLGGTDLGAQWDSATRSRFDGAVLAAGVSLAAATAIVALVTTIGSRTASGRAQEPQQRPAQAPLGSPD